MIGDGGEGVSFRPSPGGQFSAVVDMPTTREIPVVIVEPA